MNRAIVCALALGLLAGACSGKRAEEPATPEPDDTRPSIEVRDFEPGPMAMRRLTRSQYVASVEAIFGDIDVLPPTEVDIRVEGLLTVGAGETSVTPAGLERYEAASRLIAAEALSETRRDRILDCSPASPTAADDACTASFVEAIAPLVLRRALRDGESDVYVAAARSATNTLGDFYKGLEAILSAWLLSPDFLFIQERALPAAEGVQGRILTGTALASRLSYFLWNRGPDAELLRAAVSGDLDTDAGYQAQVDRMLADDEKLERGVRALFSDLYDLERLDTIEKDADAFPQFTSAAVEDAREQTLRTIIDHLVVQRADYRDLFTTRKTFMTRHLGPIYNVPVGEDWEAYEFQEGGARAGILSHVSFLALNARTSRSSPVLRGLFVLDTLLCTEIPPPPAEVNFEAIAPESGSGATARERLAVHRAEPTCAGCHNLIDPIGLALENFDAIGQFRTEENSVTIDTHGDIFGESYADVRGFQQTLRASPLLTSCMVEKLFMHAVGREAAEAEDPLLAALGRDFEADGYDFVALMRHVALTHGFRATSGPREVETAQGEE